MNIKQALQNWQVGWRFVLVGTIASVLAFITLWLPCYSERGKPYNQSGYATAPGDSSRDGDTFFYEFDFILLAINLGFNLLALALITRHKYKSLRAIMILIITTIVLQLLNRFGQYNASVQNIFIEYGTFTMAISLVLTLVLSMLGVWRISVQPDQEKN